MKFEPGDIVTDTNMDRDYFIIKAHEYTYLIRTMDNSPVFYLGTSQALYSAWYIEKYCINSFKNIIMETLYETEI